MKAYITITRDNKNNVHIMIEDKNSDIRFVEMKLTLENYAMLITGLSSIEGEAEYRGLEYVGKTKIVEQRQTSFPWELRFDRKKIQNWLIENKQEEGWLLNSYLGSQISIQVMLDGRYIANYSVYKYV